MGGVTIHSAGVVAKWLRRACTIQFKRGGISIYISYSRVSSYLSCPYQHYLRYVMRLEKKKPDRPLYFGTDFHKLLELRNNPKELKKAKKEIQQTFYAMPASWQGDIGENYTDVLFQIFEDYQELYQDQKQPQKTEEDFSIQVGDLKGEPIVFVGRIDELYLRKRHGEKYIIVGEHKTFSVKPSMDILVMNPQKCLYAKAVQFLYGMLPQKVKWDYIRSTAANPPMWLEKSGRFSSASSTTITPMSWRRACLARGINDPKVLQDGDKYEPNIPGFFFQTELDIDPNMVDAVWDGYLYTAKQIIKQGHKNTAQNISRNCSYCSYHDICYAELTGGDVDYIIDKDYQERKGG